MTSGPEILENVSGQFIEFKRQPIQASVPVKGHFSNTANQTIDTELQTLSSKGVMIQSKQEPEEFVSPVFIRTKKGISPNDPQLKST